MGGDLGAQDLILERLREPFRTLSAWAAWAHAPGCPLHPHSPPRCTGMGSPLWAEEDQEG